MGDFTRQDTFFIKGIAILCMMFHHIYPNICYRPFFLLDDRSFLSLFAATCKITVSLLTIMSGYGLAQAYRSRNSKSGQSIKGDIRFVFSRYIQLFSYYWPASVLIGCYVFIRSLCEGASGANLWNNLLFVTGFNQYIGDWYLLAIIILYALFPLLYRLVDRFRIRAVAVAFLPWILYFVRLFFDYLLLPFDHALFYIFAFSLGIYLSIAGKLKRDPHTTGKDLAKSIVLLVVFLLLRQIITLPVDAFVALALINVTIRVPAGRGIFTRLLQSYGKASPNIWLLHYTLISISYAFFPFTSRRDYIMQFLIVAAASLPISIALNKLKDVTRFNRAIKKLRSIVD